MATGQPKMTPGGRRPSVLNLKARKLARRAIYSSYGLLENVRSFDGRRTRTILYYHSVGSPWGVTRGAFERQIAYLSERFRIAVLRDLKDALDEPKPVVCVTFDDGHVDNYEHALPILERYGAKATFFLVSSKLGDFLSRSSGHRAPLMTLQQAREIASLGHEIGAHTRTHPRLTRIPAAEARREIADSKRELEDALSVDVTSFAYPYGDHDETVRAMVQREGYLAGVTNREGLVRPDRDWMTLPRLPVTRSIGTAYFRGKVSSAVDLVRRMAGTQ